MNVESVVCLLSLSEETLSGKPLGLPCMLAVADKVALNPHMEYFCRN